VVRDSVDAAQKLTTHINFDVFKIKILERIAQSELRDHFIGKPEALSVIEGFRVIDYSASVIVPAPVDCRYAALSYVWGSASGPSHNKDTGQLPHTMPQTIQDAIQMTKALRLKYL